MSCASVTCADEFCDLFERLSTQTKARENINNVIGKLRLSLGSIPPTRVGRETGAASDDGALPSFEDGMPSEIGKTQSQFVALDQQEYLYANQDFWRQLNIVLDGILRLQRRAWLRLLKTIIITVFIFFAVFSLMRWFMYLTTPEVFRHEFDPAPYIFAVLPTTFYLLVTVMRGKRSMQLLSRSQASAISLAERGGTAL